MKIKTVLFILSVLMVIISLFMLLSAGVSLYYQEMNAFYAFLKAAGIVLFVSVVAGFLTRSGREEQLGAREGFLIVSFGWIFSSLAGAIPFVISKEIPEFTDAFLKRCPVLPQQERLFLLI